MPTLIVTSQEQQRTIFFETGSSLREILDVTDIRVRSGCRGYGSCGLCKVLIEEGSVNSPTSNESLLLTQEMLEQGIRLACQISPMQDISIRIINTAPKSDWRSLSSDSYFQHFSGFHMFKRVCENIQNFLGLAVDLGTTHISVTLWDMVEGKRLTGRTGLNKQCVFGSDVMTRVIAATQSEEYSHEISYLAVDSIGQAILDICSREGYDSRRIRRVSIVGNTAELGLLSEKNYDLLLQPKFWTSEIDCQPVNTLQWCILWNIFEDAVVDVISPLAGFVGSDLLAGIMATEMTVNSQDTSSLRPQACLLIDFGTNTEIALWDGARLWVTSAAGGPAFEGSGLSCGMPASPGAIYQIEQNKTRFGFTFKVIAGDEPEGICGSGLVDLLAGLLDAKIINAKGKFTEKITDEGFVIHKGHNTIAVKSQDIDVLQRAKGAIGAGIQCLIQSSGTDLKTLEKIYVCGAFGKCLNIKNAQKIGLLPQIPETSVQLCGNTALAGCEMLLLSSTIEQELKCLREKSCIINMSDYPEFDNLFMENLYLRPMGVN